MKKLNIKSPKYAIPLIVLPFVIFLNFIIGQFVLAEPTENTVENQIENLNPTIPEANLDKRDIKKKFETFQNQYKNSRDFTAIDDIDKEFADIDVPESSSYTEEEKNYIDSINTLILTNQKSSYIDEVKRRSKSYAQNVNQNRVDVSDQNQTRKYNKSQKVNTVTESSDEREMRLFKEQMLLIDSITRSPEEKRQRAEIQKKKKALAAMAKIQKSKDDKIVPVSKKSFNNEEYFNTVRENYEDTFIKAMIDENLKVVDGSRVRIRIMDDISVGDQVVKKGSYLFGTITNFRTQRLSIRIESVLIDNTIVSINLVVYDADGMEGLYVPTSKFMEFTKDLGGDLAQGANSFSVDGSNDPANLESLMYGLADRSVKTSSKALAKAARRNKANIKYSTIVFLIDPKQL